MKQNFKKYPLLSNAFTNEDINKGIKVIKSKNITMSKITLKFEKKFARKMGVKYALMTNSGSSANLLVISALINPLNKKKLNKNDEILIPAVCWSTSLWPIIQNNLKPVFVDVDLDTFNIDIKNLEKKISKKTKAIMLIHVLGTCSNMSKLMQIAKKNKLIVIEDTCESLGAKFNKKLLGTFGKFGTFSFYYSHQITSGEGGMVVCNNKKDYNILKSMRSHGWSRNTHFHNYYKKKYKNIDERFIFIGPGYNLRPTEFQAAIALNQFDRLDKLIKIRNNNRNKIISSIIHHSKWKNQFTFMKPEKKIKPSWFGLPILINKKYLNNKNEFLNYLTNNNIENRPIISGNFLNQPASKLYKFKYNKKDFHNSEEIEKRGFFIGLHTQPISANTIKLLVDLMLNFTLFK